MRTLVDDALAHQRLSQRVVGRAYDLAPIRNELHNLWERAGKRGIGTNINRSGSWQKDEDMAERSHGQRNTA